MTSSFDNFVIRNILANNQSGITSVNELHSISSGNFWHEDYKTIRELIKKGNLELIDDLLKDRERSGEYFELMQFKDQNGLPYLVTVYDSDQLNQDPQVIEIFQ